MEHRGRIRVEICGLFNALVVKILVTLLGIVPRSSGTAYHASTGASNSTVLPAASSVVPIPAPTALANPTPLTPEMDQVFGKMIAKGPKVGRLFPLHVSPSTIIPSFPLLSSACNVVGFGHKMWHRRLGHPNFDVLRTLFNSGLLGIKTCSSFDFSFDCTSCKLVKSKVLTFPYSASRASQCFDIIHSDVWGIAPIVSHAHYKYFVTFIDDFSRFTWVYFFWAKAKVFLVFKRFLALIETQFSTSIKVLRSNSGGEYMSNEFQDFLQSKRIISQRSCRSTSQQNGIAERKNRHLLDVVRTLLLDSSVPPRFWCEALSIGISFDQSLTLSYVMEHECWQNAMQAELQALEENHTWDIVPCPPTVKPIGNKWVFSVKLRSDGFLDRYKARLVALAIAASHSWQLHQMDVKNVFLHGDLQEEIYMKLPSGTQAWFEKFCSTILSFSFTQSQYDYSLFFHTSASGIVLLLVYVDDIIITGTDCSLITKLQQLLHTTFHMKDLGQLTYFLGLEVHHQASGIFVNQHKYIQDLITLAGLEDTSSVDTPMEVNVKYRKDEGDLLDDPTLYRRLVRSLIYLTIARLDIFYVVHQVSQFMTSPRHLHLVAVRCIIRYLRGSLTRGLFFPTDSSLQLVAYSDANWDRVSKSSTEVEYRAMSTACSEIVWLRGLLEEFGFPQTTTPLHADNTSAIQIATNPVFHERTKHIEVDCHSIQDTLESQMISLPHISSNLQVADIFTKALTRQ
ncbi:Retrovirus-related Pol polyprotein from transposon RE1 [Vitis vinifera]|uniref:Retrovirus-related Pol polyprotein from transposon RE1 n=1 Tax=Vitis vinifera TaxID=29760 RepID=A0A438H8E6_VITVI|nr:Retrovirus-related Pol polyprotein from transposon RE1 [Vitis vinifera]